jgi:hypothetical protein
MHQISHIVQAITVWGVLTDQIWLPSGLTAAVRVHPVW